jgi:hypothetical protein
MNHLPSRRSQMISFADFSSFTIGENFGSTPERFDLSLTLACDNYDLCKLRWSAGIVVDRMLS